MREERIENAGSIKSLVEFKLQDYRDERGTL